MKSMAITKVSCWILFFYSVSYIFSASGADGAVLTVLSSFPFCFFSPFLCICGNFIKKTNLIKQIQALLRTRVCYDGPSLFCLVSEPLAAEILAGEEEGEGTGGGEAE
jgi:hypothetical protein